MNEEINQTLWQHFQEIDRQKIGHVTNKYCIDTFAQLRVYLLLAELNCDPALEISLSSTNEIWPYHYANAYSFK